MDTQLLVKIDKGLKSRVAKKAKRQDLSLSGVVKMALYAYDKGLIEPGMMVKETFKPSILREMKKISKEIKEGKNLSSAFNSAKEMDNYLDAL